MLGISTNKAPADEEAAEADAAWMQEAEEDLAAGADSSTAVIGVAARLEGTSAAAAGDNDLTSANSSGQQQGFAVGTAAGGAASDHAESLATAHLAESDELGGTGGMQEALDGAAAAVEAEAAGTAPLAVAGVRLSADGNDSGR